MNKWDILWLCEWMNVKKKMCEKMYEFIYSVVYCGLLWLKDVFIYRVYFGIIIFIGGGGGVWGISVFIEVIGNRGN